MDNELSLSNFEYIDELWIIMDNNINEMLALKSYIHKIIQKAEGSFIPTKLICNYSYSYSVCEKYAEKLEIPLLEIIPEIKSNDYIFPFMTDPKIRKKLKPYFDKILYEVDVQPSGLPGLPKPLMLKFRK